MELVQTEQPVTQESQVKVFVLPKKAEGHEAWQKLSEASKKLEIEHDWQTVEEVQVAQTEGQASQVPAFELIKVPARQST